MKCEEQPLWLQDLRADHDLWQDTKSTIEQFCVDYRVDHQLYITYQEMIAWVWNNIQSCQDTLTKKHLKQRLNYLTAMVKNRPLSARIVSLVALMDTRETNNPCINQFYIANAIYNAFIQHGVGCKDTKEAFYKEIQCHIYPCTSIESTWMKRYIDYLTCD